MNNLLLIEETDGLPGWFNPWGWIAIGALAIVLIVILIVLIVRGGRNNKKTKENTRTLSHGYVEEDATEEEIAEAEEDEKEEAEEEAQTQEESAPESEGKNTSKKSTAQKPAAKGGKKVEEKNVPASKTYHISKRKSDGMWQVKAAGGAKALKLFKTQAEAIDYAKTVAGNQEGKIMIHKEDGSFRRLTYK